MASPLKSFAGWMSRVSRIREARRRRQARRLLMESLENRQLLAADNLAAIAGTAFVDVAEDGLNAGDYPVGAVDIHLYRDGGNGSFDAGAGDDALVGTQTTLPNGAYRFNDLQAGTYFVQQSAAAGLLQRPSVQVQTVSISATDAAGVVGSPIDSYDDTTQTAEAAASGPVVDATTAVATEAIGGERDLYAEVTLGSGRIELFANSMFQDRLAFSADSSTSGRRIVTWDGADGDATSLDASGLGGIDLTEAGKSTAIRLVLKADQPNGEATVRLYTDAANWSTHKIAIPVASGIGPGMVEVMRFSDFTVGGGTGVDLTNVGAIELEIEGADAVDGEIDDIAMIGPTVFNVDFANLVPMSIGDLVWHDTDNNGVLNGSETGIGNVDLTLYADTDGSGDYTDGIDTALATTATNATGNYRFTSLLPGDYIVRVDASNFLAAGSLAGRASSTGNQPTADPDDNVNDDDNGDPLADTSVVAQAVTLNAGSEPVNDGDADPHSNLTVDFGFVEMADLIIVKLDTPDPVVAGQQLTYNLTVTNDGPSEATGVVATDSLPPGVSFVSATPSQGTASQNAGVVTADLGSLAKGASATVSIIVTVDPSTTGVLVNRAVVTGDKFDPILVNNESQVDTTITREIDLAISKSDTPDPVVAGQQLTYTLQVVNQGPSDASGVTVTDTLPNGVAFVSGSASQGAVSGVGNTVTASLGDLAQGASASITILVDVDPATRGVITNTATVTANETETNTANNTDTEPTTIETLINLAIDKTASATRVAPGAPLTYTIDVQNQGPSNATGVTVTDTLPAGVSFVSGSAGVSHSNGVVSVDMGNLTSGASGAATITVNVGATTQGTLTNVATVSANESETTLADNSDDVPVDIEPLVDLVVFKADSPDPATAGQQLTYTLSVINNGPADATGVSVTDALPSGVSYVSSNTGRGSISESSGVITADIGNLAAGETVLITIVVDVDPGTRGVLTNVATVQGNEQESNTTNNRDEEDTQINALIDLAVTKVGPSASVAAGSDISYTITVTNNGPSDATGVTMVDTLPAETDYVSAAPSQGTLSESSGVITASLGNLAVGASATITVVAQVDVNAAGTITNRAEVDGTEPETRLDNNTALAPANVDALMSSIGGFVYVDANDDGAKDPGEAPIAGVVLQLIGVDANGAAVNRQTTTAADGSYLFDNLLRGTYNVIEVDPAGYRDGQETPGILLRNGLALASTPVDTTQNDQIREIQLPAGADGAQFLFGELLPVFSKRLFLSY